MRPAGPVGILLQTCLQRNAAISFGGVLSSGHCPTVHLFQDPLQFVTRTIYRISEGAAFHVVATNRRAFAGTWTIDRSLTLQLGRAVPKVSVDADEIDSMPAKLRDT